MDLADDRADTTTCRHAQLNYLKRKLEDLEEVHRDGKRQHATEVERLKNDQERARKANKEQTEQIQRLKKQSEFTEARMQELKKAVSDAQSEARELRVKLRGVEAERDRLMGKQTSLAEARKALVVAEARKKDDVEECEKRISELQSALTAEKRRSAEVETKLKEDKPKFEREAREARVKNTLLEQKLERLRQQLKEAESQRSTLERESSSTSESLTTRVEELEAALQLSANEYRRLSSSSMSSDAYNELKLELTQLRLQVVHLQRKLGNSEDQVYELAQLIRQTQDNNSFLSKQLQEAQEELDWRRQGSAIAPSSVDFTAIDSLRSEVDKFLLEEERDKEEAQSALLRTIRTQEKLGRENATSLLDHLSSTERLHESERMEVARLKSRLADNDVAITKLSHGNESRQKECDELQKKLVSHSSDIFSLQNKLGESEKALIEAESRSRIELARREELLRKERELTGRLQSTVHKSKMAEDALKDEIEQLTSEFAGADAYREAYLSIAEEMRGLVARNALAEDEANRLSQFNAEILSHRNPTQKILYVDRIRRELAETKQKLVLSTQDHESAASEIATLKEELAMYKSVSMPFEGKPRTTMTRVRRIPLNARKLNVPAKPVQEEVHACSDEYSRRGDMTMDELS